VYIINIFLSSLCNAVLSMGLYLPVMLLVIQLFMLPVYLVIRQVNLLIVLLLIILQDIPLLLFLSLRLLCLCNLGYLLSCLSRGRRIGFDSLFNTYVYD
jgi:hypothetical protein